MALGEWLMVNGQMVIREMVGWSDGGSADVLVRSLPERCG